MTYHKSLIIGLLAGLSAAPIMVRAADNSAWQSPPSVLGTPPILAPYDTGVADNAAPLAWKRSEQAPTADIRFKKPDVAGSSAAASEPETKLNRLPAPAAPTSVSKAAAQIEITDAADSATSAPKKQPASLSALLAPALQQQQVNRPPAAQSAAPPAQATAQPSVPQINTAAAQSFVAPSSTPSTTATPQQSGVPLLGENAAASTGEAITNATPQNAELPKVRLTDEQLQLVARILNDGNVVPAAQEEPLPTAPEADPFRRRNGEDRSAGGTEPYGDGMYCDDCCPPRPPLFWVAGVEATFLSPDLNSNSNSWTVEDVDEGREEVHTSEDVDSLYLSPRVWIGVQGCAWGANLRYWHLNASESTFDPSIGRDGTWDAFDCGKPDVGFFSMSRLEAYTIDLEITRRFCLHDCWMQGSFGVRHAEIQFADSITGTALATDANLFGYAESDRYTRGTGVVFGLYGRKPLFPCSCVHWYYNLRWSAMWGPTRTAVETGATVLATTANAGSVNGAYTCVDDNLFIGEVQLGLEWDYALQCVPANAFFRAGVEYQRWSGGMGYSEAGSFAGVEVNNDFEQVGSTFASAAAPELDLIGLTLGTGLTW